MPPKNTDDNKDDLSGLKARLLLLADKENVKDADIGELKDRAVTEISKAMTSLNEGAHRLAFRALLLLTTVTLLGFLYLDGKIERHMDFLDGRLDHEVEVLNQRADQNTDSLNKRIDDLRIEFSPNNPIRDIGIINKKQSEHP